MNLLDLLYGKATFKSVLLLYTQSDTGSKLRDQDCFITKLKYKIRNELYAEATHKSCIELRFLAANFQITKQSRIWYLTVKLLILPSSLRELQSGTEMTVPSWNDSVTNTIVECHSEMGTWPWEISGNPTL